MAKKITIGLIYGYNEGWIAGTYYIENLIRSLFLLPEESRPNLKIYIANEKDRSKLENYGFASEVDIIKVQDGQSLLDKLINKISYLLSGKYVIVKGFDQKVNAVFPNPVSYFFHRMPDPIYWIPDFQEIHLPEFFTQAEVRSRFKTRREISKSGSKVVFSSQSALDDYTTSFPKNNTQNFVLPFAVHINEQKNLNFNDLMVEYSISGKYFVCSNQFWAHKDHQTLLHAMKVLKDRDMKCELILTGNPQDPRNPDYYDSLVALSHDLKIDDRVKFLGFIPRDKQIMLLKHSIAIVQPSRFEGWSTIVEDAKAINKEIVLSDLAVHKEQLPGHNGFFEVGNSVDLASKLKEALNGLISKPDFHYPDNQLEFGRKFMQIFSHES